MEERARKGGGEAVMDYLSGPVEMNDINPSAQFGRRTLFKNKMQFEVFCIIVDEY